MSTCSGCGGVVGQDCWNPQECEWISRDMAARNAAPSEVEPPQQRSVFRQALAEHLTAEYARYVPGAGPIHASDIESVYAHWDEGETSDNEDYGLSPRLPELDIKVTLLDGRRVKADAGFIIGQLIQAML